MKNTNISKKFIITIISLGITLAVVLSVFTTIMLSNMSSSKISTKNSGFSLETATGSRLTVQEITNNVAKSVVEIQTEVISYNLFGQPIKSEGSGSGVIVREDGYIVTNNHVIAGASKIQVTLSDKTKLEATLVGSSETLDIAVLKVDKDKLSAAELGNSDELAIGQMAVVIGNPLGVLGGTVSAGIFSSLNREIAIDDKPMSLIQTDASVNPGNSGGGLFDQYGHLVGIVVAKGSGNGVEGIGFAIPINDAISEVSKIINSNK